jgi:hypothetical protein
LATIALQYSGAITIVTYDAGVGIEGLDLQIVVMPRLLGVVAGEIGGWGVSFLAHDH